MIKKYFFFFFLLFALQVSAQTSAKVWSAEKANAWYQQHKWITGADFLPSTAINQLEMPDEYVLRYKSF